MVQSAKISGEKIKVALAVLSVVAGVVAFYFLSDRSGVIRAGALIFGLLISILIGWTSEAGQGFVDFSREAVRETKKVVWPTRKEAVQVTVIIFVFALTMALFLWGADKFLEFLLYDVILGWKK